MIGEGSRRDGAVVRAEQPFAAAEIARLYDAFPFEDDIPFYLELARQHGTRVLEVACGSGRVLVPLVQSGFEVVGVDASPHMLALAREKLDSAAALSVAPLSGAAGRATLVEADMRRFELDYRDFDLAIVAVKSFAYLTERSDQSSCLDSIARHLRPGGVLAIDLLHPRPEWIAAATGSLRDDMLHSERGLTVSRAESVVSTDLARQVRVIRSIYEVIDERGAVVEKRFVEWPYRWTHRFEAELLLERAGFVVDAIYGGYRREQLTSEANALVFVARKPE